MVVSYPARSVLSLSEPIDCACSASRHDAVRLLEAAQTFVERLQALKALLAAGSESLSDEESQALLRVGAYDLMRQIAQAVDGEKRCVTLYPAHGKPHWSPFSRPSTRRRRSERASGICNGDAYGRRHATAGSRRRRREPGRSSSKLGAEAPRELAHDPAP